MCMYWPGIIDDIKESISVCKACFMYATKQQREPYAADAQVKLWTLLSLDNFEFQNQYFIMVLDMATKFFVVRPVHSQNTDATIQVLMSIFSEHGMPIAIRCDRGHNFVSYLFQQLLFPFRDQIILFQHLSPQCQPSRKAIRTVKGLMNKCTKAKQSWRLALLEYLTTPLESKTPSPSQLNGIKFSSMLPNVSNFSPKHSDKLAERHDAQLQCDTHGRNMEELPVGSTVGYHDHTNNQFHIGIVSGREGRSYAISTENGRIISQNHIDLRCTNVPYIRKESVSYANSNFKHVSPPIPDSTNAKFKQPNKAKLLEKEITVRKSNSGDAYRTCSGRISKPATRLITSMSTCKYIACSLFCMLSKLSMLCKCMM